MRRVVSIGMLAMTVVQLTLSACGRDASPARDAGTGGAGGTNAGPGPARDAGRAGTGGTDAVAGTGGTDAVAGTGGTDAVAGTGGNGGAPPDPFPPGCVRELQARCALEGPCRYETGDAGRPLRYCYDSGTRIEYEYGPAEREECSRVVVEQVFGADGVLCYSVEAMPGAVCESTTVTYRDADGERVAFGGQQFGSPHYQLNCVATDERSYCTGSGGAQPCPGYDSSCVPGACP